ncbi:hypothetical protein K8I61_18255 [bacterium]|nr:hypothetical protein [bacterium]
MNTEDSLTDLLAGGACLYVVIGLVVTALWIAIPFILMSMNTHLRESKELLNRIAAAQGAKPLNAWARLNKWTPPAPASEPPNR